MKKLASACAVFALYSAGAVAAPFYSIVIGSGTFVQGDCPNHLSDDPRITKSNGVQLAVSCVANSPVVAIAGCHTAGLIKSRSISVACDDDVINGPTPTIPVCDGTGPGTAAGAPQGRNIVTGFSGATIMEAGTGGGSLAAATVASGTVCDAAGASVKTVVDNW